MTRRLFATLILSAVGLSSGPALAQEPPRQEVPRGDVDRGRDRADLDRDRDRDRLGVSSGRPLHHRDREFLESASQGGSFEVQASQLAERQAESPDVRRFGHHMIEDHARLNLETAQLARDAGVPLPQELDRAQQGKLDELARLTGPAFDRRYVEQMMDQHEWAVRAFSTEAKEGRDPQVTSFAATIVPQLRDHLRETRELRHALRATEPRG